VGDRIRLYVIGQVSLAAELASSVSDHSTTAAAATNVADTLVHLTSLAVIPSVTRGADSVFKTVTPSPARGSLFDLPPARALPGPGH